jgi:chromate transporter
VHKKAGAAVATVAVILPSIIVISLLASVLPNITENEIVKHAFNGIRAAVVAIITNVAVNMLLNNVKDMVGKTIFALSFLLLLLFALSPVVMVIFGCVAGLSSQKLFFRKREKT